MIAKLFNSEGVLVHTFNLDNYSRPELLIVDSFRDRWRYSQARFTHVASRDAVTK
jgi:hypothetical protein